MIRKLIGFFANNCLGIVIFCIASMVFVTMGGEIKINKNEFLIVYHKDIEAQKSFYLQKAQAELKGIQGLAMVLEKSIKMLKSGKTTKKVQTTIKKAEDTLAQFRLKIKELQAKIKRLQSKVKAPAPKKVAPKKKK